MVECTGLENRQRRKAFVSSNLTASASTKENDAIGAGADSRIEGIRGHLPHLADQRLIALRQARNIAQSRA